jgi:hypothetical protein
MDWRSPSHLAWSAIANELSPSRYLSKHSIGHVNIELRCDATQGHDSRIVYSGMTSDGESLERDALLKENIGLGVLFRDFPGRLESADEILSQLPERTKGGDLSLLRIRVSDATCRRLLVFHDEFRDRGLGEHYGLPNRPRAGEGAGCTAYATAFLDVGGLLTDEMRRQWSRTLRVPVDLIGGGEAETPAQSVSITRLLFSFWRRWAAPGEPHRELFFWDPDAMHRWIHSAFESDRTDLGRISLDRAIGMTWDARHLPTPTDPIWHD